MGGSFSFFFCPFRLPVLMRWPHAFLYQTLPFFFWFFYSLFLPSAIGGQFDVPTPCRIKELVQRTLYHLFFGFSLYFGSAPLARQLGRKPTLRYGWRIRNNAHVNLIPFAFFFICFPSRASLLSSGVQSLCTELETQDCPPPPVLVGSTRVHQKSSDNTRK